MPLEEERTLGRLLVQQGICTAAQVDECLAIVENRLRTGGSGASLGDVLRERGYLQRRDTRTAITASQLSDVPEEVAKAAKDPAQILHRRYVLVEKIGKGGMGDVWKAWDLPLGRYVALKFLRNDDPEELRRFVHEAQMAANLSHPNIAAVYEVGEHTGRPFIAMQYVHGPTLVAFPHDDRRLLVELVHDAAIAVHYAHEKGIIHRDLKPQNLIVEGPMPKARRAPGQPAHGLRVYVLDFGLAKQMTLQSSISGSGCLIGTPAYMAPEQALGQSHKVTPRSDVYGLGATLYFLLTDQQLYDDTQVYDLIRKVVEEPPVPPRQLRPDIEPDLESIVLKCLEKAPSRRYRSALELAADLRRWLDGEPILTRLTREPEPAFPYRRWFFIASAAAVILAGAFVALKTGGDPRVPPVAPSDETAALRVDHLLSQLAELRESDRDFARHEEAIALVDRARATAEASCPRALPKVTETERAYRDSYEGAAQQQWMSIRRVAEKFADVGAYAEAIRVIEERFPRAFRRATCWTDATATLDRYRQQAEKSEPLLLRLPGGALDRCPATELPAGDWTTIGLRELFRLLQKGDSEDNWRWAEGELRGRSSRDPDGTKTIRDLLALGFTMPPDFELEMTVKSAGPGGLVACRFALAGTNAQMALAEVTSPEWRALRMTVTGRTMEATLGGEAARVYGVDRMPPAGRVVLALFPGGSLWVKDIRIRRK